MEDIHYRIKEIIYENGDKEFTPQYMNGSINGWAYEKSNYVGSPIEELPNELYWFDFTIWNNGEWVSNSFGTYDEAFSIIKKDKSSKLKQNPNTQKIEKEIIHLMY